MILQNLKKRCFILMIPETLQMRFISQHIEILQWSFPEVRERRERNQKHTNKGTKIEPNSIFRKPIGIHSILSLRIPSLNRFYSRFYNRDLPNTLYMNTKSMYMYLH